MSRANTAAIERYEAADYVFTAPDGRVNGRADDINDLKTGNFKAEAIDLSDTKVRVYGKTAVVTGKVTLKNLQVPRKAYLRRLFGSLTSGQTWVGNGRSSPRNRRHWLNSRTRETAGRMIRPAARICYCPPPGCWDRLPTLFLSTTKVPVSTN